MKIVPCEQGSTGWLTARAGKVTASELSALVTPLGKLKEGDGPRTYLAEKLAEAWLQGPLPVSNFWNGQQGQILEESARPTFELETGLDVRQVGFITTDDGRCGCSPDGLAGDDTGLEIKCPHIETHIRYLLAGVVPPDYVIQVQGSLWVTGFRRWFFYSYRRKMPSLIIEVLPDEKIQKGIGEAVKRFNEQFDAGFERLVKLNGGKRPPKREPMVFSDDIAAHENYREDILT